MDIVKPLPPGLRWGAVGVPTTWDHESYMPKSRVLQEIFIWKRKLQEGCRLLVTAIMVTMVRGFEPGWRSISSLNRRIDFRDCPWRHLVFNLIDGCSSVLTRPGHWSGFLLYTIEQMVLLQHVLNSLLLFHPCISGEKGISDIVTLQPVRDWPRALGGSTWLSLLKPEVPVHEFVGRKFPGSANSHSCAIVHVCS